MSATLEKLLAEYALDHQHPLNRGLHVLGITMIGSSVLTVWVLPPLGAGLFVGGWAAQFLGHAIEGKRPSFSRDPRFMAVGAIWYAREVASLAREAGAWLKRGSGKPRADELLDAR